MLGMPPQIQQASLTARPSSCSDRGNFPDQLGVSNAISPSLSSRPHGRLALRLTSTGDFAHEASTAIFAFVQHRALSNEHCLNKNRPGHGLTVRRLRERQVGPRKNSQSPVSSPSPSPTPSLQFPVQSPALWCRSWTLTSHGWTSPSIPRAKLIGS